MKLTTPKWPHKACLHHEGKRTWLSYTHESLLWMLMGRKTVSVEDMTHFMWGTNPDRWPDYHLDICRIQIYSLRRKLKTLGGNVSIKTVRQGQAYMLEVN